MRGQSPRNQHAAQSGISDVTVVKITYRNFIVNRFYQSTLSRDISSSRPANGEAGNCLTKSCAGERGMATHHKVPQEPAASGHSGYW
jgi:hypothetical protein